MTRYALLLLLLCIAPIASAAGLTAQSPADGATVDEGRFSFSTASHEVVSECRLLVDGEVARAARYNQTIAGRSISYTVSLADGTYTWQAVCATEAGELTTEERTVTIATPQDTVKVTSGPIRGTMIREVTLRNSADQPSITIDKIAPGDYISIVLDVPPSKVRKELYVRSKLSKDGRNYLWLTHRQQNYNLWEGENATIDVGASTVLLEYKGLVNNRAVVVAHPNVTGVPQQPEDPAEEPAAEPGEPQEPEQQPVEEPESPAEPAEEPVKEPAANVTNTTESPPAQQPPAERPGVFTRFVSWLASVFGI